MWSLLSKKSIEQACWSVKQDMGRVLLLEHVWECWRASTHWRLAVPRWNCLLLCINEWHSHSLRIYREILVTLRWVISLLYLPWKASGNCYSPSHCIAQHQKIFLSFTVICEHKTAQMECTMWLFKLQRSATGAYDHIIQQRNMKTHLQRITSGLFSCSQWWFQKGPELSEQHLHFLWILRHQFNSQEVH